MDYFLIGRVQVNGVDSASTVSVGSQVTVGASSQSKNVNGHGSITGDMGSMPSLFGWMVDNDLVDTPAWAFTGVFGPGRGC